MTFKSFVCKHKVIIIFFCVFVILIGVLVVCFNKNNSSINESTVSYEFITYLKNDTKFNRNISTVLPSAEILESQKVIYYFLYNNGSDSENSGERMLNMTIEYTDNAFEDAIVDIKSKAYINLKLIKSTRENNLKKTISFQTT